MRSYWVPAVVGFALASGYIAGSRMSGGRTPTASCCDLPSVVVVDTDRYQVVQIEKHPNESGSIIYRDESKATANHKFRYVSITNRDGVRYLLVLLPTVNDD